MNNTTVSNQPNILLARVVVALAVCVLLTAAVVAYLWLRPAGARSTMQIAYVAVGTEGQLDLFLSDPAGRSIKPLTQTPEHEAFATWSPDGKTLAFVRLGATLSGPSGRGVRSGVYLLTLENDKPVERYVGEAAGFGWAEPAWSPDGRRLAWLRTVFPGQEGGPITGELVIVNVATLATETHPLTPTVSATGVSWSPDGNSLAFVASRGVVYVPQGRAPTVPEDLPTAAWMYNLRERALSLIVPGATQILWSPTGEWLAYTDIRKGTGVRLVRPDGTGAYALMDMDRGYPTDMAWSPDGARLAATAWDEGLGSYVLYVYTIESGSATAFPIADRQFYPQYLRWSPDGMYLSYSLLWAGGGILPDGNLWIVDTKTGALFAFPDSPGLEGLAVWRPGR